MRLVSLGSSWQKQPAFRGTCYLDHLPGKELGSSPGQAGVGGKLSVLFSVLGEGSSGEG